MTVLSNKEIAQKMTNQELIDKVALILDIVRESYKELNAYENELINRIFDKRINARGGIDLNNNVIASLKYYANRLVDEKQLKAKYPHIYQLGLRSKFSKDELLNTIKDKKVVIDIIRECSHRNPKYVLQYKRKR